MRAFRHCSRPHMGNMLTTWLDIFRPSKKDRPPLDAACPIAECSFVVVDTELTGLNQRRDSLISIGAFRMRGKAIELGTYFYRMVNPERVMDPRSVVVHGVMPSEVESEASIKPILGEFLSYLGDAVIVGHCIEVDLFYLNKEANAHYGREILNHQIDTHALYERLVEERLVSRKRATGGASTALFAIAEDLGIGVGQSHHALGDAYITAQVFQRFLVFLSHIGVTTLGELLSVGDPAGIRPRDSLAWG